MTTTSAPTVDKADLPLLKALVGGMRAADLIAAGEPAQQVDHLDRRLRGDLAYYDAVVDQLTTAKSQRAVAAPLGLHAGSEPPAPALPTTRPAPAPAQTPVQIAAAARQERAPTAEQLLADAEQHDAAAVRRQAAKVRGLREKLAAEEQTLTALLAEHNEQERARRERERAAQAAREEVKRAEQALAVARARLAGHEVQPAKQAGAGRVYSDKVKAQMRVNGLRLAHTRGTHPQPREGCPLCEVAE